MKPWKYMLYLGDIFNDVALNFEQGRDEIVRRIKRAPFYGEDLLEEIVERLQGAHDWDAFNAGWEDFYDFADDKLIWVEIIPSLVHEMSSRPMNEEE